MKQNSIQLKQGSGLLFKQWGRKRFSVFTTLKKIIKISVLPVAYFISVPVLSAAMVRDTAEVKMEYDLDEIEVSASRAPSLYSELIRVLTVIDAKTIEQGPATTVQELLEQVATADIRQRGAEGVQADISIRGGTFDQTLILLNGINITDPQTGHHNLNLPVSLSQIERIEVLNGPAARVYGPNAFSGAINIVTRQNEGKKLAAQVNAGSFGYFDSNLSGGIVRGKMNHLLAGNYKKSDGYIENTDFEQTNFFYSGKLDSESGDLLIQAGFQNNGFGANSFYTPVYPNQYESTQTLFSSARFQSFTRFNITPSIYYRRHSDKFMLFRDNAPDWYENHNYHRTRVGGAAINSWHVWKPGKISLGAEFRNEKILSNVLGEEMDSEVEVPGEEASFTHSKSRQIVSLFAEQIFYLNDLTLSIGIMGNHISDRQSGWSFFPGVDAGYDILPSVKIIASWNTSLRMPTFTDLYYSGPTNLGNPQLKPEKSETLEAGLKINNPVTRGHVLFFHSKGKNIIDWVKSESDELWQAANHTSVINTGFEANFGFFPRTDSNNWWNGNLQVGYMFNNQRKIEGELISFYVLDYLKHKFTFSWYQPLIKNVALNTSVVYQDRAGTFTIFENGGFSEETDYKPFWVTDLKLSYKNNRLMVYVSASNVFNTSYFDYGNIVQPGRWLKTGINYTVSFD